MANLFQVRNCWEQVSGFGIQVSEEGDRAKHGRTERAQREPASGVLTAEASYREFPAETRNPKPETIIPITYINSAANLKAFVGEHGGTVCTSTNAPKAVEWALSRGDKVLFFPDQHLGRNTGVKLGYDPDKEMCLWDPHKPLGGNTPQQ